MPLTELVIKQAKPEEKTYLLSDGKGLGLEVHPNGKKYWIIRYWVNKKEHRTSAGVYPAVTLKEARDKNYELRKSLDTGKPVGFDKETFSAVTEEWLKKRIIPAVSQGYLKTINMRLKKYIYPALGSMKLADISSNTILQLCRSIEKENFSNTAMRVKRLVGQIFRYAIATDRIAADPTYGLQGALQVHKQKHYAALTDPAQIALLMRHIDGYPYNVMRCALKLSAWVFCRPGEIRAAEWKEFDWESLTWRIPAEKMKMERPHIVPLAHQVVEMLRELQQWTGKGRWLFPSARGDGRCLSENGVRVALRSMGYGNEDMTPHGFRGMASTILYENNFSSDVIERQLAHAERSAVKAAYNHAEYLPQRREMMQWYADWLDSLNK